MDDNDGELGARIERLKFELVSFVLLEIQKGENPTAASALAAPLRDAVAKGVHDVVLADFKTGQDQIEGLIRRLDEKSAAIATAAEAAAAKLASFNTLSADIERRAGDAKAKLDDFDRRAVDAKAKLGELEAAFRQVLAVADSRAEVIGELSQSTRTLIHHAGLLAQQLERGLKPAMDWKEKEAALSDEQNARQKTASLQAANRDAEGGGGKPPPPPSPAPAGQTTIAPPSPLRRLAGWWPGPRKVGWWLVGAAVAAALVWFLLLRPVRDSSPPANEVAAARPGAGQRAALALGALAEAETQLREEAEGANPDGVGMPGSAARTVAILSRAKNALADLRAARAEDRRGSLSVADAQADAFLNGLTRTLVEAERQAGEQARQSQPVRADILLGLANQIAAVPASITQ